MIQGLILAGGEGKRVGHQDKGLILLHGKPLIQWAVELLQLQLDKILISINRNQDIYQTYAPCFVDEHSKKQMGPLSGLLSVITHLDQKMEYLLVIPCDMPLLPNDLIQQFLKKFQEQPSTQAVYAVSPSGEQPCVFMLKKQIILQLNDFFYQKNHSLIGFLHSINAVPVHFSLEYPFLNANDAIALEEISQFILSKG